VTTPSGSSTTTFSSSNSFSASSNAGVLPTIGVLLVAGAFVAGTFLIWRRRSYRYRGPDFLRPDDLEMLRFIRDRGGKVVEAEIRERFNVPRTSAWRQTKRLEQLGYIRIRKLGSQNQLELIRRDFE
jgi:uncharacterized membrane protein